MYGLTNTSAGGTNNETAPIAAMFGHVTNSASLDSFSNVRVSYDREYFTFADNIFTVKRACDVTIFEFSSARFNPSTGSSNTVTHQVLINGTSLGSSTSTTSSHTTSLNVGDNIQLKFSRSTAGAFAFGLGIRFTA